jgi:hypothetical protein
LILLKLHDWLNSIIIIEIWIKGLKLFVDIAIYNIKVYLRSKITTYV